MAMNVDSLESGFITESRIWNAVGFPETLEDVKRALPLLLKGMPTLNACGMMICEGPRYASKDKEAWDLKFAKERKELLDHAENVFDLMVWIKTYFKKRATINRSTNSYGLKHRAEEFFRAIGLCRYVANGEFIAAAILAGFRKFHQSRFSLSFAISEGSLTDLRRLTMQLEQVEGFKRQLKGEA